MFYFKLSALRAAAALALASGSAFPAFAHASLVSVSPPVGGAVAPPAELRLTFSEGIEPKFSSVALAGPGGPVPVGPPAVAPGDGRVLVVKIGKALAPGSYSVKWRAVSVDTHRTEGAFAFTVK